VNRATAIEQPRTAYTTGECPHIDYRESAARASERPDLPRCDGCGCEADRVPVFHSPRCTA
jgi:hypothetical protein